MKRSEFLWAGAMALVLAGCGGSRPKIVGGGLTRAELLDVLKQGMAVSWTSPQPGGNARVGRKRPQPRTSRHHIVIDTDHVYLDPQMQLWVGQPLDGPNDWYFFEDEALTIHAGSDVTQEDPDHRFGLKRRREVLSGPRAGDTLDWISFLHEDGGGQEDATGVAVEGRFEWHATWPEGGIVSYSERWDMNDGSWYTFVNAPDDNGNHRVRMESSTGLKADWRFEPDLSGNATITGPSSELPATMTWDATGNGEIRWADGSTEPYNVWS